MSKDGFDPSITRGDPVVFTFRTVGYCLLLGI